MELLMTYLEALEGSLKSNYKQKIWKFCVQADLRSPSNASIYVINNSIFAHTIQLHTGFYCLVLAIVDLKKKVHKWTQVKSTAVSRGAGQPTLSKMSPLKRFYVFPGPHTDWIFSASIFSN